MLTLPLLPDRASDKQALACEQSWIQQYLDIPDTRQPHGVNAVTSFVAALGVVASPRGCHAVYTYHTCQLGHVP